VALVRETAVCSHVDRGAACRQQAPCVHEADLQEIGMRRGAIGRPEYACHLKAIRGAGRGGECVGAGLFGHRIVQVVTGTLGDGGIAGWLFSGTKSAVVFEVWSQQKKHGIEGGIDRQAPGVGVVRDGQAGGAYRSAQPRIIGQRRSEPDVAALRAAR
jgi:hypothetical protein